MAPEGAAGDLLIAILASPKSEGEGGEFIHFLDCRVVFSEVDIRQVLTEICVSTTAAFQGGDAPRGTSAPLQTLFIKSLITASSAITDVRVSFLRYDSRS